MHQGVQGGNPEPLDLTGSPGRTRTSDMVVNSHPLYQLSYRGRNLFLAARAPASSAWGPGYSKSPRSMPPVRKDPLNPSADAPVAARGSGGRSRNRTGVNGFAVRCITTMLSGPAAEPPGGGGGARDIGPAANRVKPSRDRERRSQPSRCIAPEMAVYRSGDSGTVTSSRRRARRRPEPWSCSYAYAPDFLPGSIEASP